MAKSTKRVYVLVKAYPQPSLAYQETVCCAGISDEGEFVRLYPIRFRMLKPEARFDRFDLIEVQGEAPRGDYRPESFHVDEGSIRVVKRAAGSTPESKAGLWLPHVSESLPALREANVDRRVSLGIVRPDARTVKFSWESAAKADQSDREITTALRHQTSLIEQPLKPLADPEYSFVYTYQSGGKKSRGQIHDWEVQAAYWEFKKRYADRALEMLRQVYQERMVEQNLHLFLGTMKAHPRQFIIVGLLRTSADLSAIESQGDMFARPRA